MKSSSITQQYAHEFQQNQQAWDQLAQVNVKTAFYDVAGFKEGKTSLQEPELAMLPDVKGKDLLHLQCHFGLDTLSWARMGARATGVDFSPAAIDLARSLADELSIPASFICSNIYELPETLEGSFDIVFVSYGALCWLPDLKIWGSLVRRMLRPGGQLVVVEFHPVSQMIDEKTGDRFAYPYFYDESPLLFESEGSYADPTAPIKRVMNEWCHPVSEIITALLTAGLSLDEINEYPYSPYGCWPMLEETTKGRWEVKEQHGRIPLLLSLRATAPSL
ncbi:MAG: methyltransferase domain-containing protein [Myxococcales bacterium]|nr:methyltransferase domain-containing protein [Myxococcales bacterium]MCB9641835.1 methyltransferase domain-containing protein [Myxococcales bacterium]